MAKLQSSKAKQVIEKLVITSAKVETVDVDNWKSAINTALKGNRTKLYNLLSQLLYDPVLADALDKLTGAVTNAEIMFQVDGESIDEIEDLMDTPEFDTLLREIALKFAWGKSVIEVSFSPDFSVFSFPRKNIRITNMDKPLSERKKFIANKDSDTSGYDYTKDDFVIECGDDDDLGLLVRAALFVIYKRGGWGDWAQFVEIFAMPFLSAEYEGFDETTRQQLFDALGEIGGKPYAAVPKGVNLKVTPAGSSGSSSTYESFNDKCDRQILIAMLGNTMTTLEGSSRAQSKTHMETQEQRFRAIRRYTQRVLNRHLLPLLIKRGYKAAGGFFSFPDAGESISTKDRVNMALNMRDKGLPVDEDYIFEISGVAKAKKKNVPEEKKTKPAPVDDPKPKPEDEKQDKEPEQIASERNFLLKILDKVFTFAPTGRSGVKRSPRKKPERDITGKETVKPYDEYSIDIDKIVNKVINDIYGDKEKRKESVNKDLFDISNEALQHGIDTSLKDIGEDKEFVRQFKENAAVFAAFKNHQQTKEIVALLYDEDGKLRPFYKFKKLALQVSNNYNVNWLQTEYNTAVRAALMAANLKRWAEDLDLYPNLEYLDSLAAFPRETHQRYVGTILPFYHEAWSWLLPPSEWNCQCGVRPTDKEPTTAPVMPDDFDPIFINNPAESAEFVNTKETPYYKNTEEELRDSITELALRFLNG